MEEKLTEDETVLLLMKHLENHRWQILSHCIGHQRGIDIIAIKNSNKLFIEVKGAKASEASHLKTRPKFDSGQIKTHFGKAIVKAMETRIEYPNGIIAIAHPDDSDIRKVIGPLIPELKRNNIVHYWVSENGMSED